MTSRPQLLLHAGTLNYLPLDQHLNLAKEAGFDGVSIRALEYTSQSAEAQTVKSWFFNQGFMPMDVDCVGLVPGSLEPGGEFFGADEQMVLKCASELEARAVNLVILSPPDQLSEKELIRKAAESAARLADAAKELNLLVQLEPIPMLGIKDIFQAKEILDIAQRPNLGLQLDAWHFFRGTAPDPGLLKSVDPKSIFSIQICDANEPDGSPTQDTLKRRRLPGKGVFDLTGFLGTLFEAGVKAPISVEIFSEELNTCPPDEVARQAYESTAQLMEQVL